MLKQFFRDSAIYGLAGILSRGISLLLVPVFTRVLLPGDYGIVDLLTIVASLVYLTIALEISQAVPRFWGDASTEEGKVGYASTGLWFTVAVYTAFCVAAALAAPQLGRWVLRAEGQESIVLAAIAMMYATGIF